MICDKYPVNVNSICLLRYNIGNHSCKYEHIQNNNNI